MIKIIEKAKCCGCGACVNVCPKQCIEMQLDNEGFLYPVVDENQCVECNLCDKVCPLDNSFSRNEGYKCAYYGAFNRCKEIIKDSSSGGIFWLITEHVINNNGVVYGVELKEDFNVVHSRADTLKECIKYRKSKYLQSNTEMVYRLVQADLELNRLVLFSGTPCQIAGLYSYLNKNYDKLITCDVVCHGVPSKTVFDKYIAEINAKFKDKAVSICWRDKRYGWGPNRVSIQFASGNEVITTSQENPYQKGFLDNLYLRPSCYECPYAKLPRVGDISLADFWGYEGRLNECNINEGLSLVIISSEKGQKIFNKIKDLCIIERVTEDYVRQRSRHAYIQPIYNNKRGKFYKEFYKKSFESLSKKYIYPSLLNRVGIKLKRSTKRAFNKTIIRLGMLCSKN